MDAGAKPYRHSIDFNENTVSLKADVSERQWAESGLCWFNQSMHLLDSGV